MTVLTSKHRVLQKHLYKCHNAVFMQKHLCLPNTNRCKIIHVPSNQIGTYVRGKPIVRWYKLARGVRFVVLWTDFRSLTLQVRLRKQHTATYETHCSGLISWDWDAYDTYRPGIENAYCIPRQGRKRVYVDQT